MMSLQGGGAGCVANCGTGSERYSYLVLKPPNSISYKGGHEMVHYDGTG